MYTATATTASNASVDSTFVPLRDFRLALRNRDEISPSSWELSALMWYAVGHGHRPIKQRFAKLEPFLNERLRRLYGPRKPKPWVMAASLRWPVRRVSRGRP